MGFCLLFFVYMLPFTFTFFWGDSALREPVSYACLQEESKMNQYVIASVEKQVVQEQELRHEAEEEREALQEKVCELKVSKF